jgi:hypothetical protein
MPVTYEDVAVRLGRDLSSAEQETATAALSEAEAAVRVYTGQTFLSAPHTERVVSATGAVILSQRPVTAITGYRVAGTTQSLASLDLANNVVAGLPVGVPVEIDYTAGYTDLPEAVKGVIVRAALALMSNPRGVAGVQIGGYAEQYRGGGTGVLTPDDKATLNAYRVMGGTIYLR